MILHRVKLNYRGLQTVMPRVVSTHQNSLPGDFSGDMAAGSLLVVESRKIARLLLEGSSKDDWYRAIVVENILQKRSPSSAIRQARLIRHRLQLMTPTLWEMVEKGDAETATQALLASAIKHSRLLADFMDQVVRHHHRVFDPQLSARDWSDFLETCGHLDANVNTWSELTRKKLRQVIFRILAEAKYVDSTRSMKLTPVVVVDEVRRYLLENQELFVLRCMEVTR